MTTREHVEELRAQGFTLFEQIVPRGEVETLRDGILDAAWRAADEAGTLERSVVNVGGFINHDPGFAPYAADPRLLEVLEAIFGPHVRVSFTSTQINKPGNVRGVWHADWPFNQGNAGHVLMPYQDACAHVTTLWMFSPFTEENGGTLVLPGSHRRGENPTGSMGIDPLARQPGERLVTGAAGSVVMFDSRLWHAANDNRGQEPRVSMAIRYAPWWLNLEVLRPGSDDRSRIVDEPDLTENLVPMVRRDVFERLPDAAKPLWRHWVERGA